MEGEQFRETMLSYFKEFTRVLATDQGDWVVKGFIDVFRNIYTISVDTKVVSKVIELMLFPVISRFAIENSYKLILSEHQNHYPDITFVDNDDDKIALDLKSTYRTSAETVNGFTLGAFTGYFRQRRSTKNITFPYEQYSKHFVLGVIYSRNEEEFEDRKIYKLDEMHNIVSVVKDFTFLLQEKWRIASDQTGSGNTKNIGSIRSIADLVEGRGPFTARGEEIFDDYWSNYLTKDMARAIDSKVPYRNLKEYWKWKQRGKGRKVKK
jgi:hypothetical protein